MRDSAHTNNPKNRRSFLKRSFLLSAALPFHGLIPRSADNFPIVQTQDGSVRGMTVSGIHTFRGIPYGADTSGPNRFMPPNPPVAWSEVRDAFAYGPAAPQAPINPTDAYGQSVNWDMHVKTGVSEDCLKLNIWTPGLKTDGLRPVLFYMHGGGFTNGSGGIIFDGDPLSRMGDVVVVTVNHRLGPFGFLDLGGAMHSENFASAANVGMLDLVAALTWVNKNITQFGGNPDNVTIFGQSGGGAKASTLMVMPAAQGLFHKVAVQSGSTIQLQPRENAIVQTRSLLEELRITSDNLHTIQEIPWTTIIDAEANTRFGPVVDSEIIPRHPFDPDAPEISKNIPLLIGYTREDAGLRNLKASTLSEDELAQWLQETYSDDGKEILHTYRQFYPSASPFQIQGRIRTDARTGRRATQMAERKAEQRAAPAFLYEMTWSSPAFEGRFGATHGVDLGLILGSARDPIAGNTAEARMLAKSLGAAMIAFARNGNPTCDQLPPWKSYTVEDGATMILDVESRLAHHPKKTLRTLWDKILS